ncbi:MAG TPA: hypothetical protein VF006_13400 [Longimicrobium sp.]
MQISPEEVRRRLQVLVEEKHAAVDSKSLRLLSTGAGVEYTTLARYFGLYGPAKQTRRLQQATLRALLLVLREDPTAFVATSTEKQLDLWPALVRDEPFGSPLPDPFERVLEALECLREMPIAVRIKASRTALSSLLGTVAEAGETVPEEVYAHLRQLDGLQREIRHLKVS